MYIKGGPGTGKTLILIVILFKFFFKGHKSVLLTYYPTLNKYIAYLFELYNDDKLLNDFGISKMDVESLSLLGNTGILKFDDFLLPKIRTVLNIKKTYSINDNADNASQILEIVKEIEPNNKKAIKLYEEVIDDEFNKNAIYNLAEIHRQEFAMSLSYEKVANLYYLIFKHANESKFGHVLVDKSDIDGKALSAIAKFHEE